MRIEHVAADGTVTVLKERIPVLAGEVLDAAVMRRAALDAFLAEQVADAKAQGVLFSVHLKATMMKVSDPIIFGHAVRAVVGDVYDGLDASPNDGLGSLLSAHPEARDAVDAALAAGPSIAMVDSDKGITNLHAPSDVIVDASMPAAIRSSGQMWNAAGELQDTKFVIPDSSYAALYAETVDHCREHGAFDPATMGTTPNVGLMAQKAEEYGSHDKTFEIACAGTVRVVDADGAALLEHDVEAGDIWRMCQTKDAPIQDWVALAVGRARATGAPAVFWLDETRAHDAELLKKVRPALDALGHRRPADRGHAGRRGDALHARARPRGAGHDLRHRQRPARLPHRPLPDPRARDEREDALDRAAHERRRPLRDRAPAARRPSTSSSCSRRTTCAGTRSGSSSRSRCRWRCSPRRPAMRAPGCSARRWTGRPAACSRTAARRRADAASSTTAAATSTSRCTGRRSWPPRPTTRELAARVRGGGRARSPPTRTTIVAELAAVQGEPVDIGGYYRPDAARVDAVMRPSATLAAALAVLGADQRRRVASDWTPPVA